MFNILPNPGLTSSLLIIELRAPSVFEPESKFVDYCMKGD